MSVKDVWLLPTTTQTPRLWTIGTRSVLLFVSVSSKVWIGYLNNLKIHRHERLLEVMNQRPKHKPLITVSNHYSMLDDPLLACMLPWKNLLNPTNVRWLPGAKNVCFNTYFTSLFFQLGKVVPIVRGAGVYQPCMDFCVERLNKGEWVHLYPEGKVNMTQEFMRLKWGVGRLVADCEVSPLVLPYWHIGMEAVLPNTKPYIPQVGNSVTCVFGEPLDFEKDLINLRQENKTVEEIRKHVTDRIQDQFALLKQEAEVLHEQFHRNQDGNKPSVHSNKENE